MSVVLHRPGWDYQLFHALNYEDGSELWTQVMLLASDERLWAYLFTIAVVLVLALRRNQLLRPLALVLVSLGVTDAVSFYGLKSHVESVRPCYVLEDYRLRAPQGCGSKPSFPSNHAANAMAVATTVALLSPWLGVKLAALGLALIVGYSRVYLGVHYPLDVLGGWALGLTLASLLFGGLKWWRGKKAVQVHPLLGKWQGKRLK